MDCSIVSMFMQVHYRASTSTTDIPPVLTKINLVCRLLLRLGTFRHTGGGHILKETQLTERKVKVVCDTVQVFVHIPFFKDVFTCHF